MPFRFLNKRRRRILLALLSTFNILVIGSFLFLVSEAGSDYKIPVENSYVSSGFDVDTYISHSLDSNCLDYFPHRAYADSANTHNLQSLIGDLKRLENCSGDPMGAMQEMHRSLTDSLSSSVQNSGSLMDINDVILLLDWADRFKYFAAADPDHALMHGAIHTYWMDVIVDWLENSYSDDYFVKYSYKFNFIRDRCEQANHKPAIGPDSKIEKIIQNLVLGKWGYLLNRFWIGTGIAFKFTIIVISLITLYAYSLLVRKYLFK